MTIICHISLFKMKIYCIRSSIYTEVAIGDILHGQGKYIFVFKFVWL